MSSINAILNFGTEVDSQSFLITNLHSILEISLFLKQADNVFLKGKLMSLPGARFLYLISVVHILNIVVYAKFGRQDVLSS